MIQNFRLENNHVLDLVRMKDHDHNHIFMVLDLIEYGLCLS